MTESRELYVPPATHAIDVPMVRRFFDNIEIELQAEQGTPDFPPMHEYYKEAGLIGRIDKRGFFQHHFVENIAAAARALLGSKRDIRVLDLGCGMGTQAILFALLGAEVVGVDLDAGALEIARRRAQKYSRAAGRPLRITFICADALQFSYTDAGPFDAAYSLFAFNMIQPSSALLDRLVPSLAPGAKLVIQDGNRRAWFNRLLRPRKVLDAAELERELEKRGMVMDAQIPLYALPPILWLVAPLASAGDRLLRRLETMTGSWLHIAHVRE